MSPVREPSDTERSDVLAAIAAARTALDQVEAHVANGEWQLAYEMAAEGSKRSSLREIAKRMGRLILELGVEPSREGAERRE